MFHHKCLTFQDYPTLMAQAVYTSFCHCFPDSCRQFGENFKNELVYLVFGWMAGKKKRVE